MIKKLLLASALVCLAALPVLAVTADKDGTPAQITPGGTNHPSTLRTEFEWSTAGMDFVPDMGGSSDGWAEWFIVSTVNTLSDPITLVEFGFPVCGPTTSAQGWMVWVQAGQPGEPGTAQYSGTFTPVCDDPLMLPPTIYTYVNVAAENIVIPAGATFWFGYDNTGMGGMTAYNGIDTYGWYGGIWDPDGNYGRTAVMQVKGTTGAPSPTDLTSWGQIKSIYR